MDCHFDKNKANKVKNALRKSGNVLLGNIREVKIAYFETFEVDGEVYKGYIPILSTTIQKINIICIMVCELINIVLSCNCPSDFESVKIYYIYFVLPFECFMSKISLNGYWWR